MPFAKIFYLFAFLFSVHATHFMMMQTTDVHGWISGHPHNETLNADFGDYISLVQHLHERARTEDFDFLLFDSGDVIEGTGLSDATPIHGQFIFPFFQMVQNYTALTMGNHDIGHASTVQLMEETFIPHYNSKQNERSGEYLTANSKSSITNDFLGHPYSIYHTKGGEKILLMGWLYNFTLEAKNTKVYSVEDALNEPWFKEAMSIPDIDMIICTMHVDPTAPPEFNDIYGAIRSYYPTIPFILFTGHRHILYFEELDDTSFTLESGKYFEVLGVVEFDFEDESFSNFSYEWMDTTLDNFYALSNTDEGSFLTPEGAKAKELLTYYTNTLHLDDLLGCSPQLYNPEIPIVSTNSLYNLYIEHIIPTEVYNNTLANTQFFIANTATLRYPLYPGKIVVNDIYAIIPFKDNFLYYPNINGTQLNAVLDQLRLLLTPNLRMTPYFDTYGTLDVTRPAYTHSIIAVDDLARYDVVCSEYDSETLGPIFDLLYPNDDIYAIPYPTFLSSTSALGEYFVNNLPCSSSCPCN